MIGTSSRSMSTPMRGSVRYVECSSLLDRGVEPAVYTLTQAALRASQEERAQSAQPQPEDFRPPIHRRLYQGGCAIS